MEAVECGAAALGMILGYYGRWVPLSELRILCGVSRDGSNARNVLEAARSFGMDARGYRRTAPEVLAGTFPVIAFWRRNHFVVVEGTARDAVFLNDPASGPRKVTRREFEEGYSGITMEMWPADGFERGGRPQWTWPLIAERLRGAGPAVAFIALTALPLGVLSVVLPAFTRVFIDNVLVRDLESWRMPLIASFLLAIALQGAFLIAQQRLLAKLQNWLAVTQSSRFVWHLLIAPVAYFTQRQTGDFAQRLQANDRIASLIGGQLGAAALQTVMASLDDGTGPHHAKYQRTANLDHLDNEAVAAIAGAQGADGTGTFMTLIHRRHGAAARLPVGEMAYPHRGAAFETTFVAAWTPGQDETGPRHRVDTAWTAIGGAARPAYVNMLDDEPSSRMAAVYGVHYQRLARLKALYDPANRLCSNANIEPSATLSAGGAGTITDVGE